MAIRDYALRHLRESPKNTSTPGATISSSKTYLDDIIIDNSLQPREVYDILKSQINKWQNGVVLALQLKKNKEANSFFYFLANVSNQYWLKNDVEASQNILADFVSCKDYVNKEDPKRNKKAKDILTFFQNVIKKSAQDYTVDCVKISLKKIPKNLNVKNPELNKQKQEATYKQDDSVLKQSIKDGIAEGMNTTYFKESVDKRIQEAKSSINLNPYKSVEMKNSIGTGYTASPDVRVGQDSTLGQAPQQPAQEAPVEEKGESAATPNTELKQDFINLLTKYRWGIDGSHGMEADDGTQHFKSNNDWVGQILNNAGYELYIDTFFDEKGLIIPEKLSAFVMGFLNENQGGGRLYLSNNAQPLGGQNAVEDPACKALADKVQKNLAAYKQAYSGAQRARLTDSVLNVFSSRRLREYFFGNQGAEQLKNFLTELNDFIKKNFEACSNTDAAKYKKELYGMIMKFLDNWREGLDGSHGSSQGGEDAQQHFESKSDWVPKLKKNVTKWFNKDTGLLIPRSITNFFNNIFNAERKDGEMFKHYSTQIGKVKELLKNYTELIEKTKKLTQVQQALPAPQAQQTLQQQQESAEKSFYNRYGYHLREFFFDENGSKTGIEAYGKCLEEFKAIVEKAIEQANDYCTKNKLGESTNLFMNLPKRLRESVARLFEDASLDMEKYRKAFERQYNINNWIELESDSGNLQKEDAIDCIKAAKAGDPSAKYYLLYKAGPILKQVYQRNFLGSDKQKAGRNGKNAEDFMTLAAISLDQGYGTGVSKVTGGEKKQEGALESFDPSKLRTGVSAIAAFMNIYRMVLVKGCQEYNAQDNNRGIVKDIVNKENKNEFTDIDTFGEENRSLPSQMQMVDNHDDLYSNEFLENWKDFTQDWEMNKAKSGRTPAQVLKHFLNHPGASNMRDLAADFGISRGGYLAMINKAIEIMDDYYIEPNDFREGLGEFGGKKLASYLREARRSGSRELDSSVADTIETIMEKYHLIPLFKIAGIDGRDVVLVIEKGGATGPELRDSILGNDPSFKSFAKEFNEVIDYDDVVGKPLENYSKYEVRIVNPEIVGSPHKHMFERKYNELDTEDLQNLVQRVVSGCINHRNKNPGNDLDWTNVIAQEIDAACPEWDHPKNFKQKAFNMVKDALEPMGFEFKKRRSYSFKNIF